LQTSEPVFFGKSERPLAGWIHRAAEPARCGVVVCNPFGYEAICAHRSLRHFAEAFAAAGIPTLRFDYDGTGDSAGDDREPGRVDAWVQSTRDAMALLRELTGVECVYLVGVRLGALIATLASLGNEHVAGIVAIAPVVSGKAYLRELSILQTTLELEAPPAGITTETVIGEGAQEAVGFAITKETKAVLGAVNLGKLETRIGAGQPIEMLVLDREDLPAGDPWVAKLKEQGLEVDARKTAGYVEMVLDPHKAIVPEGMIKAATEWLWKRAGTGTGTGTGTGKSEAAFGEVVEEARFIDDGKLLFGIVSRSRTGKASKRAFILLNAGSTHHIGPNRLYVGMARAWAAAGAEVLRLDISGIGESRTRAGLEENVVYSSRAVEDIGLAVDFMRRRGSTDITLVGLCSGAYHAFKSAAVGQPIAGFVAINPLCFDNPPKSNAEFASYRVARDVTRYQGAARDVEKWKKLLRGEVRVRAAVQTVARHAAGRVAKRARDVSRRLNMPWKDDIGVVLESMAKRSISQRYIFAREDPGNQLLHDGGGSAVITLRKTGALAIDIIEGPDHTFTPVWSHQPLLDLLHTAISSPTTSR
jgi:alpha-beta hydrolase superfamily lysophospholipase